MTYAEQQYLIWSVESDCRAALNREPLTKLLFALNAYQPYDNQPGESWHELRNSHANNPKALAAIQAIVREIDRT